MVKFQKKPRVKIRMPPMKGPKMRVPVMVSTLVARALPSISRGTVAAMRAWRMGWDME